MDPTSHKIHIGKIVDSINTGDIYELGICLILDDIKSDYNCYKKVNEKFKNLTTISDFDGKKIHYIRMAS
jgi:hypothetical protein